MPSDDSATLPTRALIADRSFNDPVDYSVSPPISVSTTFKQRNPDDQLNYPAEQWDPANPDRDIYSREGQPTLTRAEKVLASIIEKPTILFPSGIASTFAIFLMTRPDVIAITDGYHGVHGAIGVYCENRGEKNVRVIKLDDDYTLKKGEKLLVWLETPLNPTGECRDIQHYSDRAHAHGGLLAVDSTFAPPPTSDPFKWGADIVMHSVTKYFGGHSDLLSGSVSVRSMEEWHKLWHLRTYTGSNVGSLEAWLILRSARTLAIRVRQQSATATSLVYWLNSLTRASHGSTLDGPSAVVTKVWHGVLQDGSRFVGAGRQMELGSPCFSILLEKVEYAAWLGHYTRIFTPATSLGGVESLMEHRIQSDHTADPRLVRLSIGLESFQDLKADLIQAMNKCVVKVEGGAVKL